MTLTISPEWWDKATAEEDTMEIAAGRADSGFAYITAGDSPTVIAPRVLELRGVEKNSRPLPTRRANHPIRRTPSSASK